MIFCEEALELLQSNFIVLGVSELNLIKNSVKCNEFIDIEYLDDLHVQDSFFFGFFTNFPCKDLFLNFFIAEYVDLSENLYDPLVCLIICDPL